MRWSERLRKIRSKRIPPRGEERRAATRLEPRAAGPIGSPALRIVGGPRDAGRPSRGYRPDGCSVAGEGVPLAAGAGLTVPEVSELTGKSVRSIEREWGKARLLLRQMITEG